MDQSDEIDKTVRSLARYYGQTSEFNPSSLNTALRKCMRMFAASRQLRFSVGPSFLPRRRRSMRLQRAERRYIARQRGQRLHHKSGPGPRDLAHRHRLSSRLILRTRDVRRRRPHLPGGADAKLELRHHPSRLVLARRQSAWPRGLGGNPVGRSRVFASARAQAIREHG